MPEKQLNKRFPEPRKLMLIARVYLKGGNGKKEAKARPKF